MSAPSRLKTEIIVETERLLLRTEAPGDRTVWLKHMNNDAVMAHLGGPVPSDRVHESFRRRAEGWAKHGFSFMMLERRNDRCLIGHCGLSTIDTHEAPAALRGQPQIGWALREDAWGQGYAREAAQAVLALAFGRFGITTLFGQTSQGNRASWGLMEKLGMSRRADLDYVDTDYPPQDNPTMVYQLTREAWLARIRG
ncbi:GNAT family N-acetyltransferase [Sphingobium nicotianae]|uniref:GNAT family N-acetyltransferase n=1 Tax=Sphingobium nicotianae TaxID=2782607 RepID=A0A9X1DF63_9SPHN|nr:GNAT family N-acetyltransferase [Sphingobium nicotianae]MBT2188769.1 GNAT family N-acetyltransferase [Sphingobium nicotianae]